MNTGQIILTLGAMILLSLTTFRVNSHFVHSGASLDETKFSVLAVSLASSRLEEASNKAFDENSTGEIDVIDTTSLSQSLGKESGEGLAKDFDDCDDFNGFTEVVDTIPSADFKIRCQVNYVNPATPNINKSNRTWHKKISVFVTSPSMADTVKMSSIFSYWYYR